MKNKELGLYVHVPFCLKKCNYCDFCSFADVPIASRERYVDRLIEEIGSYKGRMEEYRVRSIFFGGGTPTLLGEGAVLRIADALCKSFAFDENIEFTIEANPKTLTREKLDEYRRAGVNRISIGLQSIHENELKILGRIHTYEDFLKSLSLALEAGFDNINVDLMYAIPYQSVESFSETVDTVSRLPITHISAYSLIIEDSTPFGRMRRSLPLPSEDEELLMVEYLSRTLRERGFSHYEISNYAKEGMTSRHNLIYWRAQDYLGFGISAHSCLGDVRFSNTCSLDEYFSEQYVQYRTVEPLSAEDKRFEYAMLALRLSDGLSLSRYKERFGVSFDEGKEEEIARLISLGYIERKGDSLALTERGFYVSNEILSRLL